MKEKLFSMLALVGMSGCGLFPQVAEDTEPVQTYVRPTKHEVLKVPFRFVRHVKGYAMRRGTEAMIRSIAGVYAGTIDVSISSKGKYIASGSFDIIRDKNHLSRALYDADVNRDKVITGKEILDLTKIVFEEYKN